jgi:hypothetical protein
MCSIAVARLLTGAALRHAGSCLLLLLLQLLLALARRLHAPLPRLHRMRWVEHAELAVAGSSGRGLAVGAKLAGQRCRRVGEQLRWWSRASACVSASSARVRACMPKLGGSPTTGLPLVCARQGDNVLDKQGIATKTS